MLFTLVMCTLYARGVLLGILGGDVPPGYPNPDPISDQNTLFSTPVFRLGISNAYPFSDLEVVKKRDITCFT